MKFKLPDSTKNWITIIGATISIIALLMILFFFLISTLLNKGGSYLGLVTYIILPVFLFTGLLLIPIGMLLRRKKVLKNKISEEEKKLPFIDLNNPQHRNAAFIFIVGTILFLFLSAFGSYEAFHYTESVQFCGTTCHNIMLPEYTAYQNSPHARVSCAECHVGEGADWYVRSKLSGLRQVYKTIIDDVPKPIKTPIRNLRPARDICEKCHWPQKFYSRSIRMERHYLRNEVNSEWDINLEMKVGPKYSAKGLEEGIHWHINPDVKIEYFATDENRQIIPYVKYTNLKSGESILFKSADIADVTSYEMREVDCIDCHNRPAHNYKPPEYFVNNAITAGAISRLLPEIKTIAVEVCSIEYSSTSVAVKEIKNKVYNFYKENYPQIIEENKKLLNKSITVLVKLFNQNIFPEMKVRWEKYPNNIGHLKSDGCFRCHDNEHISETGKVISKDCNLCHLINSQGLQNNIVKTSLGDGLKFIHPGDDVTEEEWAEGLCSDCHEGTGP